MVDDVATLNKVLIEMNKRLTSLEQQSENHISIADFVVGGQVPLQKLEECMDRIIKKHHKFSIDRKKLNFETSGGYFG